MKKVKTIGIVLLILSIAFGSYLYIKKQYKSDGMSMSGYVLGSGLAPDLTEEEIKAMMQKKVDESKVAFSIYTEPTFEGKIGTIMFANPPHSAHNISLEVVLDNKVIIRTEKISPDQYIENIELIGEKKVDALFDKFKSIEKIKNATIDEIMQTDGVGRKLAENIYNYFNK